MKNLVYVSAVAVLMIGSSSAIAVSQKDSNININQQKINTIKSMYAKHEESGKSIDASTSGLDLLYLYGGFDLKDAIMGYQGRYNTITQDDFDSFMDCAETQPSIYVNEFRDDIDRLQLMNVSMLNNGKVRANIKGYTMYGETLDYKHDFDLMCHADQCQVNDVYGVDGYSLKTRLSEACYQ